ncbi:MAG: hypothetical protein IKP77_06110 [Acholeplasmatales bacterium]|nr:hypothetical protein [Acholeplasmatales bacterium]
MEQNQFDELEPVEVEKNSSASNVELKEYEKLLLAEANRKLREKAETLVGIGCFEQKEETVVDFNEYDHINYGNKYRGRYSLYQNKGSMDLVFICPLVENNKGDVDENKSMKPYAYDCIFVETMDDETYDAVCHAAKNNLSSSVKVLYRASFISFFVMLAITAFVFIFNLISASSNGFVNALASAFFYTATFFAMDLIMLPLLVLISIKYKKYKDQ